MCSQSHHDYHWHLYLYTVYIFNSAIMVTVSLITVHCRCLTPSILSIAGDDDEDEDEEKLPSCMDYVMHFLTIFWKVLFACVPPTGKTVMWFVLWIESRVSIWTLLALYTNAIDNIKRFVM
jgi:hypothetical protein